MIRDDRLELEKLVGMDQVVVLSQDGRYVGLAPWMRAMNMLFSETATARYYRLEPKLIATPSREFTLPLAITISLNMSRDKEIDPNLEVSFKMIRIRDNYTCQYCGEFGDTVDHIFPKSRGGPNTWGNLCVACRDCNGKKDDKLLEELGWAEPDIPMYATSRYPMRVRRIIEILEGAK